MAETDRRIEELQRFYREVDPDREKNAEPLFERFVFREIVDAITMKYGRIPVEWEGAGGPSVLKKKEPKRKSLRQKLASSLTRAKPESTRAKPVPPR